MERVGIVSRFPEHLSYFAWGYYEVKGVTGVWHDAPPGAIPMVSVFGDNRVAKHHPEWVQVGSDGEAAVRTGRYFDWDALCPSQPAVSALALDWLERAQRTNNTGRVRIDDVTFAREGFCVCGACREASARWGLDLSQYRQDTIAAFVEQARQKADHLDMTLYPDPLPGHLENRFGIDVDRLAPWIDRWIVPIYDMHYATTYWLEILAQGFRERLTRPFVIELYGLQVPEEALLHAAQVALAYADGVLIAYDNQLEKLLRICERLGSE